MRVRVAPSALFAALALFTSVAACGGAEAEAPPTALDDLAVIPEPPTPDAIEIHLAEQLIPAGQDVQRCHYLEPTTEELFLTGFDSYQGRHGHHLVLMKAMVADTPGAVIDCTDAEDMVRLTPALAAGKFGIERFPPGFAVRIARGTQLVIQQHYVNTTDKPLRVRDAAHLVPVPAEEVTTRVGFWGTSNVDFQIPPGEELSVAFDCEVPWDMKLLMTGPHMHENGLSFVTEMGPAGALRRVLEVPSWQAYMRDEPPVEVFDPAAPLELAAGDLIRTTCVFKNNGSVPLGFPQEMCSSYGYFFPALEGKEEFTCAGFTL